MCSGEHFFELLNFLCICVPNMHINADAGYLEDTLQKSSESFGRYPSVTYCEQVKGTVSRDFLPSVFLNQTIGTPWAPDSRAKAFLNSAANSPRYDQF
jgi:hypothetical protein